MMGGLDKPTFGKVLVDGKDLSTLKDEELTIFRRKNIGFIFQNYNLVPVLNVYENIVLPVELDRKKEENYLGNNIKLYRQERGITQQQLADSLNVSRQYISEVENCKKLPTIKITFDCAKILCTTVDRLFYYID